MINLNTQYRTWNRTTPADGLEFQSEFERVYANFEIIKNALNKVSLPGSASGRMSVDSSLNSVVIPRLNTYDVSGNLLMADTDESLNLSALTNIFRNDGTTPIISSAEVQNKHLYVMLDNTGNLSAMIVPDSEMDAGTHGYASNPDLLKDSFKASPGIFDPVKNGYYKGLKRIIGTLRLNSSNQIQFLYELGFGRKFKDLESLKAGQIFTEDRWKREHPGCFLAEGDTVSAMNTDFPELYKFLGNSNILPDYKGRVPRSIALADSRSIRDTQEDALQQFQIGSEINSTVYYGSGLYENQSFGGQIQPNNAYIQFSDLSQGNNPLIPFSDGTHGTPRMGNETRMKNYAVLYQIVKG